jgi:hypothetical protein
MLRHSLNEANQCPAALVVQFASRSETTSRLSATPEEELLMKKTAVGLFHILPTESEAPGTEIND